MICSADVAHIQRLLDAGLSQRRVAQVTGHSRDLVGQIARGERPDYEALRREREAAESLFPSGPFEKCPGCGAMVQMPCLACRVRAQGAAGRGQGSGGRGLRNEHVRRGGPVHVAEVLGEMELPVVGLELRGEAKVRYERVRERKEEEVTG